MTIIMLRESRISKALTHSITKGEHTGKPCEPGLTQNRDGCIPKNPAIGGTRNNRDSKPTGQVSPQQVDDGPRVGGRKEVQPEPFWDAESMIDSIGDASSQAPGLDDKQKEKRRATVKEVVSRMPLEAIEHLSGVLNTVYTCNGLGDVCQRFEKMTDQALSDGMIIGGIWSARWGDLTIDGGFEDEGYVDDEGDMTAVGILAHELGHGLDTVNKKYTHSNSEEFAECYAEEIADGQLSDYATTDEQEGFAEFARLLYGATISREDVEAKFPKTFSFFKSKGFV